MPSELISNRIDLHIQIDRLRLRQIAPFNFLKITKLLRFPTFCFFRVVAKPAISRSIDYIEMKGTNGGFGGGGE